MPRDIIIADYRLSTQYRRPQYALPPFDVAAFPDNAAAQMFAGFANNPMMRTPQPLNDAGGRALLSYAFDEIDRRYGSVDGYLDRALGVKPASITALRAIYLE